MSRAVVAAMCLLAVVPLAHAATVSPRSVCWEGEEWGLCAPTFAAVALDSLPAFPLTQSHTATVAFSLRINTTGLVWCDDGGGGVFSGRVVTCASSRALCSPHSAHSTQHDVGSVRASTFDSDVEGEYEVRFEAQFVPESVGDISVVAAVHFATCEGANATDHDVTLAMFGVDVEPQRHEREISPAIVVLVLVVCVLVVVSLLVLLLFVVRYRKSTTFDKEDSDLRFDAILIGCSVLALSAHLTLDPVAQWRCEVQPLWLELPLVGVFGCLLARALQVDFVASRPRAEGHYSAFLWHQTVLISLPLALICLLEVVVATPERGKHNLADGESFFFKCAASPRWHSVLWYLRHLYVGGQAVAALVLMRRLAKCSHHEARRLVWTLPNAVIVVGVTGPVFRLFDNAPDQRFFLGGMRTVTLVMVVSWSLLVPKVAAAYTIAHRLLPQRSLSNSNARAPPKVQVFAADDAEAKIRLVNGLVPEDTRELLVQSWVHINAMITLIVECMPIPRAEMEEAVELVGTLHTELAGCRYVKKRLTLPFNQRASNGNLPQKSAEQHRDRASGSSYPSAPQGDEGGEDDEAPLEVVEAQHTKRGSGIWQRLTGKQLQRPGLARSLMMDSFSDKQAALVAKHAAREAEAGIDGFALADEHTNHEGSNAGGP